MGKPVSYQFTFVELSSLTSPSSVFGDDLSPDDPALTLMFPAVPTPPPACAVFNIDDDDDVECDHSATVVFDSVINCVVDPPILSASLSTTITISDNDGILEENHNNCYFKNYYTYRFYY